MSRISASFVCLLVLAAAGAAPATAEGQGRNRGTPARAASRGVEGRDYVVLQRYRFLDENGFGSPIEATSTLMPRGWRVQGGVRWRSVNECRGDIVVWRVSASSPDGAIQYMLLPTRTFGFSQDPLIQQALVAGARQGGCAVSPPFNAAQYLGNWARGEMGAKVSNIRTDESLQATLDKISADGNATSRQYDTGMSQSGTGVYGTLTWPDGTRGLARVGVMVMVNQSRNTYGGAPNGFATTMVFHQSVIRYLPEREAEALKVYGTISASERVNPVWKRAKEAFLTRVGNSEQAARMERMRLMGEQSRAYARAQSEASSSRMRSWERQQASSDRSQHRYIQTIREVETWRDGEGNPVELNAGYNHGWSKPDGSYILTNDSNFDPAVELQEDWVRMQKPQP